MNGNICRTCLSKNNLQSIYDIVDDIKLSNKVMFFASIEVFGSIVILINIEIPL